MVERHRLTAAAAALLALAGAPQPAAAAQPGIVWVDNESFGFSGCAAAADALPGSEDPKALMQALRERGLADAGLLLRSRGLGAATVTLTPVSGAARCGEQPSSIVFRLSSFDAASGRGWSSNLVSRMPAQPGVRADALRSSR